MPEVEQCRAVYRHDSDQYQCDRCGYYWDRADDAPECKTKKQIGQEALEQLKAALVTKQQP